MGSQAADPDPGHGGSHGMLGMRSSPCSSRGAQRPPLLLSHFEKGFVAAACGAGRPWSWTALWEAHGNECISTAATAIHITAGKHLGPIWSGCKHLIPSTASVSLPNILASSL